MSVESTKKKLCDLMESLEDKIKDNIIKEISEFLSKNPLPVLTTDGSDETKKIVSDFIYDNCLKITPKSKSSSPKKDDGKWITSDKYEEKYKIESEKGNSVCSFIPTRGSNKGLHCGIIIEGAACKPQESTFCKACDKLKNKSLTNEYHTKKSGSFVVGTPLPGHNSPSGSSDQPIAAFLSGNTDNFASPSGAIGGSKSSSEADEDSNSESDSESETLKLPEGKKIKKSTKFYDSRVTIDGIGEIIIREVDNKSSVGGKFVDIKSYKGNYLDYVKKLSDEELEIIKKYKIEYKFIGTGDDYDAETDDDKALEDLLKETSLN